MSNKFKSGWRIIKKDKKARIFLLPFLSAYFVDKLLYFITFTFLNLNLKKKVYKLYLRYRLKDFK